MRIVIADDHLVVRKGLSQLIRDQYPSAIIEEAGDAETLIKMVIKGDWNLVITDIAMPGRSGMDALLQIKSHNPKLPVLILSGHSEEQYAMRALKAGASGFLNKDVTPDIFIMAVERILQGKKFMTPTTAEQMLLDVDRGNEKKPHEHLSDREFEVFKLIASGKSVSTIAEQMHISVTTVSTYRARIIQKMNVKTNADLTIYAIEYKLLPNS